MADIQKRKGNLLPIQKNGSTDASKSTTKSQNSNWIPPFYKNQYLVEGAELAEDVVEAAHRELDKA